MNSNKPSLKRYAGHPLFVYAGLWLLLPFSPDDLPPYRRAMVWTARQLLRLMGDKPGGDKPGSGGAGILTLGLGL